MSLNRNLSGIEFSFEPSPEQSKRIAEAYLNIKCPVPGIPYSAATMRAERVGDHWNIDFDPVARPAGVIRFARVSSDQPDGKVFLEVIRQASIPLWLEWDAGAETELEPMRDQFPSAIVISEKTIAFVLTPPQIVLNLNDLNEDPTFTMRGRGDIKTLRFRSLDSQAIFNQTVDLNWKEDRGSDKDPDYIKRTKPFVSGPHRLQVVFQMP